MYFISKEDFDYLISENQKEYDRLKSKVDFILEVEHPLFFQYKVVAKVINLKTNEEIELIFSLAQNKKTKKYTLLDYKQNNIYIDSDKKRESVIFKKEIFKDEYTILKESGMLSDDYNKLNDGSILHGFVLCTKSIKNITELKENFKEIKEFGVSKKLNMEKFRIIAINAKNELSKTKGCLKNKVIIVAYLRDQF